MVTVLLLLFIEEFHAACGPCGTISPRIAKFSYSSLKRVERARKANRASQLNVRDLARTRERRRVRVRLLGRKRRSAEKRICGSRLRSAPQREERGSSVRGLVKNYFPALDPLE